MTARDALVADLADAIAARDAAWTVYLAAPAYSAAEDRASAHLLNCAAAILLAEQAIAGHDRRWRRHPSTWRSA